MRSIILVLHDIRSIHNVGSLLRTAECFGVSKIIFSGYTPFPQLPGDDRLPHVSKKMTSQIHKTALGAETMLAMERSGDVNLLIEGLAAAGFRLVGLEQAPASIKLQAYKAPEKLALFVGREVEGTAPEVLKQMDDIIEIPMKGQKESLNVVQAAAIALYHLNML